MLFSSHPLTSNLACPLTECPCKVAAWRFIESAAPVRDTLLGHPHHETDWVVVGSTPEAMLSAGYTQVGRDFPVFLHPGSKEEYALARTERKTAPGHQGFTVHADPSVTLEQDLERRDLTINAMAMDDDGKVIDPYGGQADLKAKLLRHVSPHFVEDPLRVLRVARFAARYHHLGFYIADDTLALMTDIVVLASYPTYLSSGYGSRPRRRSVNNTPSVLAGAGGLRRITRADARSRRVTRYRRTRPHRAQHAASRCSLGSAFG